MTSTSDKDHPLIMVWRVDFSKIKVTSYPVAIAAPDYLRLSMGGKKIPRHQGSIGHYDSETRAFVALRDAAEITVKQLRAKLKHYESVHIELTQRVYNLLEEEKKALKEKAEKGKSKIIPLTPSSGHDNTDVIGDIPDDVGDGK